MSYAGMKYKELRFIIEEELTQVYCFIQALGDCPIGVQGWHHKTFPASMSCDKIVAVMFTSDDCVLWPLDGPQKS